MSSRLIVKNIPNSTTEKDLKALFSEKGTVTDVQLKYLPDGKFRHFAFVGFRTEAEADNAREYFDKSCIGLCKIQVDTCYGLKDQKQPKPWSKHSKESKKHQDGVAKGLKRDKVSEDDEVNVKPKKKKGKEEEEILEKCREDPEFREFLEMHRQKDAKWGNDTIMDELDKSAGTERGDDYREEGADHEVKKKTKKLKDTSEEIGQNYNEEEDQNKEKVEENNKKVKQQKDSVKSPKKEKTVPENEYFTVKLRDLPQKARKKDVKTFFAPLVPQSIRMPPKIRGIAYVGFTSEADLIKALSKNKSILLGNQVIVRKYSNTNEVQEAIQRKQSSWKSQNEQLEKETESIGESGRIFMRNLAYTTTEDDIKAIMEPFGPITETLLPIDRITRQIKGFAFVSFLLPEHANKAFQALDGSVFQGRMLHLLPSKIKEEPQNLGGGKTTGSSYQREREMKIKKSAGVSRNWNALFVGQNAVTEVVAEKYGVSREQLLLDNNDKRDERNGTVAVRMALAETELVTETKVFLEENGVCLDAFESRGGQKPERSKTTLLVKNLVANTTGEDLTQLFVKYGAVARVIRPPSGITAIVDFFHSSEAQAAFKNLAYSKYKGLPLYLEWAPVGVFVKSGRNPPPMPSVPNKSAPSEDTVEVAKPSITIPTKQPQPKEETPKLKVPEYKYEDDKEFDEDMIPEPETTVFVKNLNFSTREQSLKSHFASAGRVYATSIAMKKDPKDPANLLSQGYGFVQYYRAKDCTNALQKLHDTMLENHFLELKRSNRTIQAKQETKVKEDSTVKRKCYKMLVRNVPFQADLEEITQLFQVFGKLKAIRLPKKLSGQSEHRGFAFVEFLSDKHAQVAFDTLGKSTHLYGRRLVLEWAQQNESVEELREKVAKRYDETKATANQSSSKSMKKNIQRYFNSGTTKRMQSDDEDEAAE